MEQMKVLKERDGSRLVSDGREGSFTHTPQQVHRYNANQLPEIEIGEISQDEKEWCARTLLDSARRKDSGGNDAE